MATTLTITIVTQMIEAIDSIMFYVANTRTIKAKIIAIIMPYTADTKSAFSESMNAQIIPDV